MVRNLPIATAAARENRAETMRMAERMFVVVGWICLGWRLLFSLRIVLSKEGVMGLISSSYTRPGFTWLSTAGGWRLDLGKKRPNQQYVMQPTPTVYACSWSMHVVA